MVSFRMSSWIQRTLGLRPRFKRIRRRKVAGLHRGAMSAQVIPLETRILPAAAANLSDISVDTVDQNKSSHPREFTQVGNKTFFTYNTNVTDKPILVVSEGTTATTRALDVRFSPGTQLTDLIAYQGKLYFFADDGTRGKELWTSDGTEAGTFMVFDIATPVSDPASTTGFKNEGSNGADLTISNNLLYFTASNDTSGNGANRELWVYDGINDPHQVADINPGSLSSTPLQLTDVDGTLYFVATNGIDFGRELWRTTDGTSAELVEDIRDGFQDSDISELTPLQLSNGEWTLFFAATDGNHGIELWRSDDVFGTHEVHDIQGVINGTNQGSNPSSLLAVDGVLYFAADDGVVGKELWRYDPDEPTTVSPDPNVDINANPRRYDIAQFGPNNVFDVKQNSVPHNLTNINGVIYFSANDGLTGFELWKFDTNDQFAVPTRVRDINPTLTSSGDSTQSSYPGSLLNVNGVLYFIATEQYTVNGQTNFEVWKTDGTDGGTVRVTNINSLGNTWQASPAGFVYPKSSSDSLHPTEIIQDKSPDLFRTDFSNEQLVLSNGLLYFSADNGANGSVVNRTHQIGEYVPNFEPWTIAPATVDTINLLRDFQYVQNVGSNPFNITQVGNRAFYFYTDPRTGLSQLAVSDGTPGGTVDVPVAQFADLGPGQIGFNNGSGDKFYFFVSTSIGANQLWVSDGTALGTFILKTIRTAGFFPEGGYDLTVAGNRLFFSAHDGVDQELWISDGTAAGTVELKDLFPGAASGWVGNMVAVGSQVYFVARDAVGNNRVWVSDGTPGGTRKAVSNAALGVGNPTGPDGPLNPTELVNMGGIVYFAADAGGGTRKLFRTDGTDAGTFEVLPALPTNTATNPTKLTVGYSGSLLFFSATDANGTELWYTDGVTQFQVVADIAPGPASSNPGEATEFLGTFYWAGNDGQGRELFSISGGIRTDYDLNPGLASSNPLELTVSGSFVYFTADNGGTGRELYRASGGVITLVSDLIPGTVGSNPENLVNVNGRLFFTADNGISGRELYTVVGAGAPQLMRDLNPPVTAGSDPRDFFVYNNQVYFLATTGPINSGLYSTNGSTVTSIGQFTWTPPVVIDDITQNNYNNDPWGPSNTNDDNLYLVHDTATATASGTTVLFFAARREGDVEDPQGNPSPAREMELYYTINGSTPQPFGNIKSIVPGRSNGNSVPTYLTSVNNNVGNNQGFILFAANDGTSGTELWRADASNLFDGTVGEQPNQVLDIAPGAASSNPEFLTSLGGLIYFVASGTAWVTNGTAAGTISLGTPTVDVTAADGNVFRQSGGRVYFVAGGQLWSTTGTAATTAPVVDLNPSGNDNVTDFIDVGGTLFFSGTDGVRGQELWFTNGSGATMVTTNGIDDIAPGSVGSNPGSFAVVNVSPDGFGTTNSGAANSGANNGTPTLVFAATTAAQGRELWQVTPNTFNVTYTNGVTYSGTAGRAQIVKDIAPGVRSSNPTNLTGIDGTVYFSADDGVTGNTLWRTIGMDQLTGNTETVPLADDLNVHSNSGYRNPDNFILLSTALKTQNRLIFTASTDAGNEEVFGLAINHTPTNLSLTSNAVPENQPAGTVVGTLFATDPDNGDTFQYQFVAGAGATDNALFQVVGNSLQIKGLLDFEVKSTYSVRVRTTDQRGQFFERVFTVNVSNVNEVPTGINLSNVATSINENVAVPVVLGRLLAIDDALGTNNFTINTDPLLSPDAASFDIVIDPILGPQLRFIDATPGIPALGPSPDHEFKSSYTIEIFLDDPTVGNPPPDRRITFTLNIADLDEFDIGNIIDETAPDGAVINENIPIGDVVGVDALAVDLDAASVITYSLDDNAGGRFAINSSTGVVTVAGAIDRESLPLTDTYTITIRAVSSDGSFSLRSFNIFVNDLDDNSVSAISDSNLADADSIVENSPNGTPVGITAFASDADATAPFNTVTYSLDDDAGGRFAIDSNTGVITIKDTSLIDFEVAQSHNVTVRATSSGPGPLPGLSTTRTFTIAVTDDNEFQINEIIDTDPAVAEVLENTFGGPAATVGLTAHAVDFTPPNVFDEPDASEVITYELLNDAGGRFDIHPSTGVVTVQPFAIIDRESDASLTIRVRATSSDGSVAERDFVINVLDVNEARFRRSLTTIWPRTRSSSLTSGGVERW
jgi:ELWxxDGT repeat protein